ncbi:unnamed protein product [Dibothriocephalus latus]|uniref:Uncharacterized protein n=1 Tax=Dibothriocephalus latus TaxID=60516 RepID=A0A3P7NMW9_DIBLA|nr:unnamed protein product [Dibothriocephalus latus]
MGQLPTVKCSPPRHLVTASEVAHSLGKPAFPPRPPLIGSFLQNKSQHIPPQLRFTETDLLDACRFFGSQLACVIDLTYTNYYDPAIFRQHGVMYKKIFVEGHVVPRDSVVAEFNKVIDEVSEKSPSGIIAVHCTHGINRTGYLICRYLIDQLDWAPEDAVKEFAVARGYGIERENFLEDLRARK